MVLLRQRHLFALATYGLPPPSPSEPRRIPLPGPPAPSISGTLSGSLSGSRPQCSPSNSFNIFAPHPGTFLHTNHARNSSNSVLCFHILPDSFALLQRSALLFSNTSVLFAENTRGGGRAPVTFLKKNLNSPRILRGINGLRGVAEPWCPHRISPAQVPALNSWSLACHSLPGIQTGQRGNLRFRRSVGHGPACVFHRQEHPVALFLGRSAKRNHHAALAAAAVAYRPYEDGKDIFRHILRRRSAPRKQSFWRDAIHSPLNAGLARGSDPPGNLEQQHQRHRSSKHVDPNQPRRNLGLRRSSRPCRIARLRRRRGFCACHGLFGRWSFVRLAKFAGYHRLRVVHTHPPFFLYSHHPSTSLLL